MKKILIILAGILLSSCSNSRVEKEYTITEFTRPINERLHPIEGETYTTQLIQVKGYVDDTVYVSYGEGTFKKFLVKEIDTSFMFDYYGGRPANFVFDPYKAKKGKLKVKFSIL